ncbi:Chaperone protein FimC precursor [compost metagenome]|uniref:Chaperone protein LpfB n=1 Tax=Pseudomonas wadenswilerensis TaxID=1785161 RepID=A0A380SX04_9PSED|nr:Chaperone protein LpfB [Pseudomonas wadenswilerensis]
MSRRHSISFCLDILRVLIATQANASISLSASRLDFDGKHKEASITVRYSGEDVLIQSWVDSDAPDATSVPFGVTPPLARVAGKEQRNRSINPTFKADTSSPKLCSRFLSGASSP